MTRSICHTLRGVARHGVAAGQTGLAPPPYSPPFRGGVRVGQERSAGVAAEAGAQVGQPPSRVGHRGSFPRPLPPAALRERGFLLVAGSKSGATISMQRNVARNDLSGQGANYERGRPTCSRNGCDRVRQDGNLVGGRGQSSTGRADLNRVLAKEAEPVDLSACLSSQRTGGASGGDRERHSANRPRATALPGPQPLGPARPSDLACIGACTRLMRVPVFGPATSTNSGSLRAAGRREPGKDPLSAIPTTSSVYVPSRSLPARRSNVRS